MRTKLAKTSGQKYMTRRLPGTVINGISCLAFQLAKVLRQIGRRPKSVASLIISAMGRGVYSGDSGAVFGVYGVLAVLLGAASSLCILIAAVCCITDRGGMLRRNISV
jgi:hypothetical protein